MIKYYAMALLVAAPLLFAVLAGCDRQTEGGTAVSGPENEWTDAGRSENTDDYRITPDAGQRPERAGVDAALVQRLTHARFVLVSVDNALPAATARTPELEFKGDLHMSGVICNIFTGKGELEGAVLRVSNLGTTRMLCVEDVLNEIEKIFIAMLQNGARLDFEGHRLVMEQGGHRLEWAGK